MKRVIIFSVMCLSAACGSSSTAKVSGTANGNTLNPKDAVVVSRSHAAIVVITDRSNICTLAQTVQNPSNASLLTFALINSDSSGASIALTPGTYQVFSSGSPTVGQQCIAGFTKTDAACSLTQEIFTSGTVTLTTAPSGSGGNAVGSFDITNGSDHLTGSFDAPSCTVSADGGAPAASCG